MSEENVELTRRGVEAFNRRDWKSFAAIADGDVEVASRLVAMEGGYHGLEGLRRWWDTFFEFLPDYTMTVREIRDHGDMTILHFRGLGHGSASATPVIDDAWQTTRWRHGKIVWWGNFATEDEALKAVGLQP